ncbi:histidine phosphatase family protein [Emticicia sp. SJ17W-69]|uniref:histidine phosphatase family protein n=1 Tax=Emticicia sp. SJ17W-69 TaxID=3421657 RepID=UPI003EB80DF4
MWLSNKFKKEKLVKIGAFFALFFLAFVSFKCSKEDTKPEPIIVSADFYKDVLFIDQGSVQVITSEAATFKKLSQNTNFNISETGLITHTSVNAINEIEATWADGTKKKFYVMASSASDKKLYLMGWKNIEHLYKTDTTRAIVIRHAEAIVGVDGEQLPASTNWWTSCDSKLARQLSELGKKQATEYGKIFKGIKMPIKKIFSSEFCRSRQTAELMNLGLEIKIDNRINGHFYNVSGVTSYVGMINILEEQATNKNLILLSAHYDISEGISKMGTLDMADTFLMKVGTDKKTTFQGIVSYPMWQVWYAIESTQK